MDNVRRQAASALDHFPSSVQDMVKSNTSRLNQLPWLHSYVAWLRYTMSPADVTRALTTPGNGPQSTAKLHYHNLISNGHNIVSYHQDLTIYHHQCSRYLILPLWAICHVV